MSTPTTPIRRSGGPLTTVRAGVIAAGAAVLGAGWVIRDYRGWVALGPGGLPHTPKGWLTMAMLRIRSRGFDPIDTTRWKGQGSGHLSGLLPERRGPRPAIAHYPIPHRQLDQFPDPGFTPSLTIPSFVASRPALAVGRSYFEKHLDAAFAAPGSPIDLDGKASGGEIGHIHTDGSMHLVLDPADATQIIEHGWGESHPLEGRAAGLPDAYVLIYAPRDPGEVAVSEELLDAAAAHMTANSPAQDRAPSGADR